MAVVVLLFSAGSCPAQRLVVGEKAPELKVGEWLSHRDAVADSRPTLVEFFFSRSEPSLRRLAVLDGFVRDHSERLNVILMVRREPGAARSGAGREKATLLPWRSTTGTGRSRPMACNLVPFAVLFDARGRVVWFGNSSKFGDAELQRELGWN